MSPPYRFGKGPIVVALEATLHDPKKFNDLYNQLAKALEELEAGGQTTFTSDFKQSLTTDDRQHLNEDVFGQGQADAMAVASGQERRRVYYDGMKQAMDLARKLDTGGVPATIDVFWGCGYENNECWISWDQRGTPRITLFFLSDDPATPGGPPTVPAASVQTSAPAQQGLYVVKAAQDGSTEVSLAEF
jgi:hypothetical protein